MPVEVRGQLEEVGFFFFPSWGLISGTQFVRKYLCPLSHLDDPSLPYPSLPGPSLYLETGSLTEMKLSGLVRVTDQ